MKVLFHCSLENFLREFTIETIRLIERKVFIVAVCVENWIEISLVSPVHRMKCLFSMVVITSNNFHSYKGAIVEEIWFASNYSRHF